MTTDSGSNSQQADEGQTAGTMPKRTAWQIWLHPIRTSREMESLDEETATLRDLLTRTERDRERLMTEYKEKDARREKIDSRREEEKEALKATIARLESEAKELNRELGEWRQTRMELDAIAEQMNEWEQVKERYEDRIKMLTLRLRDAMGHRDLGQTSNNESDILEEGETPFLTAEERRQAEKRRKDSNVAERILSDFLSEESTIDMTASDASSESQRAFGDIAHTKSGRKTGKSATQSSIPGRRRLPKDDTDWLISLPPE